MVCLWNQGSSDVLKFPEKGAGCVGAEIDAVKVSFCAGLPVPSPTHTHTHTHSQLTDARTLTYTHSQTHSHTHSHTLTHTHSLRVKQCFLCTCSVSLSPLKQQLGCCQSPRQHMPSPYSNPAQEAVLVEKYGRVSWSESPFPPQLQGRVC